MMSFYYTKVPSQWTPISVVKLHGGITLKPANRVLFRTHPGKRWKIYFDTLYFISQASSEEEHFAKLIRWAFFHALVLDENICDFIESDWLGKHRQTSRIGNIRKHGMANAYPIDFTNIARQVYWLHEMTGLIDYRTLYEQYEVLDDENMSLLHTYLMQFEQHGFTDQKYSLFGVSKTYWQIAKYVSVLEAIIKHASNCPGSNDNCPVCNKRLTHRQGSEKELRESYFKPLIPDQAIKNDYLDIINTAYTEIRHPTAHAGLMPKPRNIPPLVGTTEVYDTNRAIQQFPLDLTALLSLAISVRNITRYLLLHKLFQLNTFPTLNPLKATRIGGS